MADGIVTVGGGHGWETGLVAALGRPGAQVTVVRRCADMTEVLAIAATGQIAAVVAAAGLRGLTGDAAAQLVSFGVALIAVTTDDRAATLAERIGVAGVVADDVTPEVMIDEILRILRAGLVGAPVGVLADPSLALPRHAAEPIDDASGDLAAEGTADRGSRAEPEPTAWVPDISQPAEEERGRAGRVIAVWGPAGAPGRSTVALGIADRAAAAGQQVLLIDADVYGGVLASALGLLDESAGLAGACRLAGTGRLDAANLTDLCWSIGERCTILTGISRVDRWPEVRPSAIPGVIEMARSLADLVIVDCSAQLEADEELSFDTMAPRRNGATVAVLESADTVLAVAAGDPPGMERLVRALEELAEAHPQITPQIVFNRVRRTAATQAELTAALRRFSGMAPTAFLPEDRAACDLAWKRGRFLGEVAHKSALSTALRALTASLTG